MSATLDGEDMQHELIGRLLGRKLVKDVVQPSRDIPNDVALQIPELLFPLEPIPRPREENVVV